MRAEEPEGKKAGLFLKELQFDQETPSRLSLSSVMGKQKKTAQTEGETDAPQIIVVKKCVPMLRTVRTKEQRTIISRSTTDKGTTCETSGNRMRICVNLMPVLASAREEEEEDEREQVEEKKQEEEEEFSCPREEKSKSSSRNGASIQQSVNSCDSGLETRPASQSCDLPLAPPSLTSPGKTSATPKVPPAGGGPAPLPDRPWMDDLLFSNSRSDQFRLHHVSVSSLEDLLQTVTQKLLRRRRRCDEGPGTPSQSDAVLLPETEASLSRSRRGGRTNIEAAAPTSADGLRKRSLRPLHHPPLPPADGPTLILTMRKTTTQ